jgi:hypothetical protein
MTSWLSVALAVLLHSLPPTVPTWHTDYAAARDLARKTDRPLFVVFRCEH